MLLISIPRVDVVLVVLLLEVAEDEIDPRRESLAD